MNNKILESLSYGVYVVSTKCPNNKTTGCIANSLMQITYDTIAVSIHHNNYTNKCIKNSKKFAISVLGVEVDDNVIPIFGFQSGEKIDKFEQVEHIEIDGLDVIENAVGYIVCDVINQMETETHTVFLGKITDGEMLHPQIPMTYAYYHTIKKGKSPKNAPTYIEEIPQNTLAYKCKICGYIYNGDITKEPESFVCPVCKKGKEFFEQI